MNVRRVRPAVLAALFVCLGLATALRIAGADAADLDKSCPPFLDPPLLHRRSIAMTGGSFGQGTMDVYPGVAILRINGSHYQMGYQHGAMLREAIAQRISGISGRGLGGAVRALAAYHRLPAAAREEIKGTARGANATVPDLITLDSLDAMLQGSTIARRETEAEPDWMVVIYHPADGQKFAAITRPGSFGVMAGMREQSCCLVLDASAPGADPAGLRRSLGTGLCGLDPEKVAKSCEASVNVDRGKISVKLDAAAGLVCLSADAGRSWSAVDVATETWRPECGECGGK